MPHRKLLVGELAGFLRAIAHPRRIKIIEELKSGEKPVGALRKTLAITHSGVSQHLMILRAHRVVAERRSGRQILYRLRAAQLTEWLAEGMRFMAQSTQEPGHSSQ